MNGLLRLIGNENKKLAKQTGLRVLLIVIALLTVLLPIPVALFSKVSDSGSRLRNDTSVSEGIERARSHGDALEESYWRRFEKANSFFSNDIDADDISWKADVFYDEYVTMLGWLYASRHVQSGEFTYENIENSSLGNIFYNSDRPDFCKTDEHEPSYFFMPEVIGETVKHINAEVTELENDIKSYTLRSFYQEKLDSANEKLEQNRRALDALTATPAELPPEITTVEEAAAYRDMMLTRAARSVEAAELNVYGWQLLRDRELPYGGWQYVTVTELISSDLMTYSEIYVSIPRILFESGKVYPAGQYRYGSYEHYLAANGEKMWTDSMLLARYSLENDIPLTGTVKRSAKTAFTSFLSMTLGMLIIFVIIVSGTILSNEYSSGTVRLLLIRPRSRAKILASKMLSMYIWWLCAAAVAAVMLAAECMILYGVKDIFTPSLFVIGGSVAVIPAPLMAVVRILLSILSASPIVLFALLISTLVKRSALPIALSMMARFSSTAATAVALLINETFPSAHLEYSPLPYLDLTAFLTNATSSFISGGSYSVVSTIASAFAAGRSIYHLYVGIVWMATLSVLMAALSFLSFTKQQIKN